MRSALHRALVPLAAGPLAGLAVGLLSAVKAPPGQHLDLGLRLAGLLVIPGLAVGAALVPLALLASPAMLDRLRSRIAPRLPIAASLLLLAPVTAVLWMALVSLAGRHFLTAYHHVGLAAFAQSFALLLLTLATLSLLALAARLVAPRVPAQRPLPTVLGVSAAVGLALALATAAHGVYWGNPDGTFTRAAFLLSGFGVLKKPELDLTPVLQLGAIGALSLALMLPLRRFAVPAFALAVVLGVAALGFDATRFERSPVAVDIDARPTLPARCFDCSASAPTPTATASPGASAAATATTAAPPSTPARPTSPATASTRTARAPTRWLLPQARPVEAPPRPPRRRCLASTT
jgi:hypothetical protein